jgi:hypothetical protein
MFKAIKPVLAATVGVVAVSSGLLFSSPAEARDGCGRGWRFSRYWGQCVPMARVYASPYFLSRYYWANGGWVYRHHGRRHRHYRYWR